MINTGKKLDNMKLDSYNNDRKFLSKYSPSAIKTMKQRKIKQSSNDSFYNQLELYITLGIEYKINTEIFYGENVKEKYGMVVII